MEFFSYPTQCEHLKYKHEERTERYLQPVIDGGVNIDMSLFSSKVPSGSILIKLPADMLLMIGEGNIEVKGFVPLIEAKPDERVLATAVLYAEDKVTGGIERRLNSGVAVSREDKACGEEFTGRGVLEADFAAVAAGDDAETSSPDPVGLEPLAALVSATGAAWGNLVDSNLANDEEGVLHRLLLIDDLLHGVSGRRRRHREERDRDLRAETMGMKEQSESGAKRRGVEEREREQ